MTTAPPPPAAQASTSPPKKGRRAKRKSYVRHPALHVSLSPLCHQPELKPASVGGTLATPPVYQLDIKGYGIAPDGEDKLVRAVTEDVEGNFSLLYMGIQDEDFTTMKDLLYWKDVYPTKEEKDLGNNKTLRNGLLILEGNNSLDTVFQHLVPPLEWQLYNANRGDMPELPYIAGKALERHPLKNTYLAAEPVHVHGMGDVGPPFDVVHWREVKEEPTSSDEAVGHKSKKVRFA